MDEIPKEYEEAALVDGYTRMQAFFKIVLPEAATGIAATAVFCFITAWNEYAFALIMTNRRAQTAPPFIPARSARASPEWTVIAAGTFLFLLPVAIFTFLLREPPAARRHLRRDPQMIRPPVWTASAIRGPSSRNTDLGPLARRGQVFEPMTSSLSHVLDG